MVSKREIWQVSQGRMGLFIGKKFVSVAFVWEELFAKNLRGGVEKVASNVLTSLTDQNYGFPHRNQNCSR